jgi:hypothetical protein
MALPVAPLPRDVVRVADEDVPVRGLSRAEAIEVMNRSGDLDKVENWLVACGCDVTEAEAHEWRNSVSADVAGPVVDRIVELSGLSEGARKSG